ncbi:class I SAM-dependent methyltransferase [Nocardioides agariphilus]|uniref:Class I SAM-dependent methyltransferase n=1 Tax=Nocardioides agariphilus TaxID=433664 RepID=A0A930YGB7_9ACTN|nr:class I SAM-dependent methyltransferase [Nocardioides agariphilus]MBF4767396.1 class I SAM-dependent methyltransferase [Nocardioides agariphilus]
MSAGSPSLQLPDYWWYVARERLLGEFFAPFAGRTGLMLDVGSADGPSVSWVDGGVRRFAVDIDPRGIAPGSGVLADIAELPFRADAFDVVGAFDVIEHCDEEDAVLTELRRVLRPGGRLLVSVPAYTWAWTDHDVHNDHRRRYTRGRLCDGLETAGYEVLRSSYAFASIFPIFAANRLAMRLAERVRPRTAGVQDVVTVPRLPPAAERTLVGLSRADGWLLRRTDVPFGSSVFAAALKRA